MNPKQIGITLMIIGLLLAVFTYIVKVREDAQINNFIKEKNSCYLTDGTCLHEDRDYSLYIFGGILSSALIILGVYLIFYDRTQKALADQQIKVSAALHEAKKLEKEKDEFNAFLAGFSEDEKKVLKAIKEQEGVQQSTLRYRTGISKTSLSLMLRSLEERGIVSRKEKGKTNQVFLRKKF
jgi:DNA-binding MarR family transcriptional regulator